MKTVDQSTRKKDLLCSTSMMSHLVAYNFKILTGTKQMSTATRFRAGNETSATIQPSGKLYRPYINDKNYSDDHSTSKEATDVSYPRTIIICDIIEYRTKQNKSKLNKLLNFGNYTLYFWESGSIIKRSK